jgi:hypothetical protein
VSGVQLAPPVPVDPPTLFAPAVPTVVEPPVEVLLEPPTLDWPPVATDPPAALEGVLGFGLLLLDEQAAAKETIAPTMLVAIHVKRIFVVFMLLHLTVAVVAGGTISSSGRAGLASGGRTRCRCC